MVHRIFTVQHARLRSLKEIENPSGSMQSCFISWIFLTFNQDKLTTFLLILAVFSLCCKKPAVLHGLTFPECL